MNLSKKKNERWLAAKMNNYGDEESDDSQDHDNDQEVDEEEDDYNELDCENNTNYDEFSNLDDISATNSSLMQEIVEILGINGDINCTNALALNKEMQKRLLQVREKMVLQIERIKGRFMANQKNLSLTMKYKQRGVGIRGAYLKGGTFYFKGNMFFKDIHCRSCPNNLDYVHRSEIEREMFPMDFELRGRHVWSMTDKYEIVKGIKEQVIDHLSPITYKSSKRKDKLDKQISLHTEKLTNLLEKVNDSFHIDWKLISMHSLKYRHSPTSANAMWNVYLMPEIKRGDWSNEENKNLLDAARRHNYQDWKSIAAEVKFRSDYQCFVHFQTKLYALVRKQKKWTPAEDKRLLDIVNMCTVNGVINWNAVSSRFPNRSKARCSLRYSYTVNPVLSHAPFTPEEDLMLLAAVEEYGKNFACMPRTLFPNRSTLQLRNRYNNTLCHRDKNNGWTREDDKKLMDFVAEYGQSSWIKCAEFLGTHTRTSCRGRFVTITKFFKKYPNAKLEDLQSRPRRKDNCISAQNWTEKLIELRKNPDAWKSETQSKTRLETKKRMKEKKLIKPQKAQKSYIEKLRSNELELYNFFKYAYNFKLLSEPCTTNFNRPFALEIVQNACGFTISPYKTVILDDILPYKVKENFSKILQSTTRQHVTDLCGYRLPPNWSTLMGFRALCVQSNQNITHSEDITRVIENSQAVQLFRQRLRVILYTTVLLSRLNPENVSNFGSRIVSQQMHESSLGQAQTNIAPYLNEPFVWEHKNLIVGSSNQSNVMKIEKRKSEPRGLCNDQGKRMKMQELYDKQNYQSKHLQIKKELD